MSVPTPELREPFPPYVPPASSVPTAGGDEPSNEELSRTDQLVALAAQPQKSDWLLLISGLVSIVILAVAFTYAARGFESLMSQFTAWANGTIVAHADTKSPRPSRTCEDGMVYVETDETSAADFYCLDQATYDELIAEAEAQYEEGLTRGKPVFLKWLGAHKLDTVKTESAREKAAERYICQSDYGDGALYAATKTGQDEDELDIAIGDKIVTIDGYDPTDVFCVDGKPGTPSNPPKVEHKDPSDDPAAKGNVPPSIRGDNPRPEPSAPSKESPGQPGNPQDP